MNQNDKDAAKWMEANSKWQQRRMYEAKENGDEYYIDEAGYVIINKDKGEKND